jgi:hypothetical protein
MTHLSFRRTIPFRQKNVAYGVPKAKILSTSTSSQTRTSIFPVILLEPVSLLCSWHPAVEIIAVKGTLLYF